MIVMSENGPIPNVEECMRMGVKWGFFMGWSDLVFSQNSMQHIKEVYGNAVVQKLNGQVAQEEGEREENEPDWLREQRVREK